MKLGIILFIIGVILSVYLSKIKIKKRLVRQIGIIIGILLSLYGFIQIIQPDDYIEFTKTTISKPVENK